MSIQCEDCGMDLVYNNDHEMHCIVCKLEEDNEELKKEKERIEYELKDSHLFLKKLKEQLDIADNILHQVNMMMAKYGSKSEVAVLRGMIHNFKYKKNKA